MRSLGFAVLLAGEDDLERFGRAERDNLRQWFPGSQPSRMAWSDIVTCAISMVETLWIRCLSSITFER